MGCHVVACDVAFSFYDHILGERKNICKIAFSQSTGKSLYSLARTNGNNIERSVG